MPDPHARTALPHISIPLLHGSESRKASIRVHVLFISLMPAADMRKLAFVVTLQAEVCRVCTGLTEFFPLLLPRVINRSNFRDPDPDPAPNETLKVI